ncbi:MAG: acyl-CoA/acyl-ACP dehydrogenase [Proteobacteria bacterium]|nr:acyl-CoA/acyl-ACP dehydrogenase [Pseudomonadota bacterium]
MDFDFTKEQKLLRSSAQEFLKKECPTSLIREMKSDERGYPQAIWDKMTELGWLGLVVPEQYGGLGGSFLDLAILLEAMGETCLPGPFFSTIVLGSQTILSAGSEQQKETLLPQIADGELILTLAITEPDTRYGAEGLSTQAVVENDEYVLTGTKVLVENARIADYILCVARTGESNGTTDGLTLFLVDGKSRGLEFTPLKTLAYDKLDEIVFDKVRVPKQNIVGEVGRAWPVLEKILERAAVAKCAEMLGGLNIVVKNTVNYAKERKQFGKPIGGFQIIQHYCASMQIDVESSMVITYQGAWKIAEELPSTMEVAMAKAWVGEASQRIMRLGHQIYGAMGFCEETDMHLYYRRAKAGEVMFGDEGHHLDTVAREIGL